MNERMNEKDPRYRHRRRVLLCMFLGHKFRGRTSVSKPDGKEGWRFCIRCRRLL